MLLPFQQSIISTFSAPVNADGLLIIARGLGLRTIVCELLRQHQGTRDLVLILNATEEEERSLNDESQMQIRSIAYQLSLSVPLSSNINPVTVTSSPPLDRTG